MQDVMTATKSPLPAPDAVIGAALSAGTEAQVATLAHLREMILNRAAEMPEVGRVEEGLRWGQVAFLTPETKSGSSLRIAPVGEDRVALYVHCQTDLMERFREFVGAEFETEGARAVLFDGTDFAPEPVQHLIGWALRYHLDK